MASRVFPIGTPLTVVWHFSKPDGTTFDLSGYTYRVYYRTGNRQTEVNSTHLTASGNMLTVVIPADMQYAPGEYSLKLVLYQNSSIFCTLVYNVAFVLSQQMSGDPTTETQSEGGNTVHLYTVAEFYMFSPVVPTVGNDGYWYVNGNKISDGNGEFIPSSHTVEYDPATNRIIIDRGRVNQQGQSIAQVITSLADALGIASQSHNTAEQDHDRAETDHDNAGDDHTNAQSDHEAIQQLIEQYEPIVINGNVTNAPDEEDITSDTNDLLKFKDRGTIYGMGYVILRRNKTFAEQVTKINTIYDIRYDFTESGDVTIPSGSVLKFAGGSLSIDGSLNLSDKCVIQGSNYSKIGIGGSLNVGFLNVIRDVHIYKKGYFTSNATDESLIVISDKTINRPDDSDVDAKIIFDTCRVTYLTDRDYIGGNAFELVSGTESGDFYKGFYGIHFNNIFVDGYFVNAFNIHTASPGWITALEFSHCSIERCVNGWNIKGHARGKLEVISIVDSFMQAYPFSGHGIDCGLAGKISVIGTEFFDWWSVSTHALKFTKDSYNIYIDYVEDVKYDYESDDDTNFNNSVFIGKWASYPKELGQYLNLTASEIRLVDFYSLPNGVYKTPEDGSLNTKLGIETSLGGVLVVSGEYTMKTFVYTSNSRDSDSLRRQTKFMSLPSKPGNSIILGADTWYETVQRKIDDQNILVKSGSSTKYIRLYKYGRAEGTALPEGLSSQDASSLFQNNTDNVTYVWTGVNWRALMQKARPDLAVNASNTRPPFSDNIYSRGLYVLDTTIVPARPIWWTGTKWIDASGLTADNKTTGTFSEKPTAGIPVGFGYFCTDKQTAEGAANGIMIYYKGSGIWVDALGRTVS